MKWLIGMIGVYAAIVFVLFGVLLVVTRKKEISPFKLFAVADLICGGIVLVIAILDYEIPGGDLNGLLGELLLLIYGPTAIVFLLGDVLVGFIVDRIKGDWYK